MKYIFVLKKSARAVMNTFYTSLSLSLFLLNVNKLKYVDSSFRGLSINDMLTNRGSWISNVQNATKLKILKYYVISYGLLLVERKHLYVLVGFLNSCFECPVKSTKIYIINL